MFDTTFTTVLSVCAVVIAVPLAVGLWRKAFLTTTVVANRTTDDGENLTIQASFSAFTPFKTRHDEIQTLLAHGDLRKDFTDTRFKKRIEEQIAAQEQTKLKSV